MEGSDALRKIYDTLEVSIRGALSAKGQEHREVYKILGSPWAGTAVAVIKALDNTITEYGESYKALGLAGLKTTAIKIDSQYCST
jgi:hypothetical protein